MPIDLVPAALNTDVRTPLAAVHFARIQRAKQDFLTFFLRSHELFFF
jgi:hypothetical protein